jgi:CHAD domain-containing protein
MMALSSSATLLKTPRRIRFRAAGLLGEGQRITHASSATVSTCSACHKLRIQAKKLRYAAEFFAAAFPSSKSMRCRKDFVVSLEKRQDALQPASFIGNIG